MKLKWYQLLLIILLSFILISLIIIYFFYRYVKNLVYINSTSLCLIDKVTEIKPFKLSEYSFETARALCLLAVSTTKWSVCKKFDVPIVPNFKHIATVKVYDIYSKQYVENMLGYYSESLDMIILAFAGTTSADEWAASLDFRTSNLSFIKDKRIKLHTTYGKMYESMRFKIFRILEETIGKNTTIILTGHSLGGSFASICYLDLTSNHITKNNVLYTYACPRTGNQSFSDAITNTGNSFRISNDEDIITSLPFPIMGTDTYYSHFGKAINFSINLEKFSDNHVAAYVEYFKDVKIFEENRRE